MNCNNYCDSCGNCTRCGECCGALIPITRNEEKRIRAYIETNKIEPEFFDDGINMNLNCCFYDRKNKLCKIYEVRPKICRTFKCNRNIEELEKERELNHKRAYWNGINENHKRPITDFRLLFYEDPRSLIANILYHITNGTMQITEKEYEFLKAYLKDNGQEELSNCLEGEYLR